MDKIQYSETGWMLTTSEAGEGLLKEIHTPNLAASIKVSENVMDALVKERATEWSSIVIDGHRCIISLLADENESREMHIAAVANVIDEALL